MTKTRVIYHNRTSLQHLLWNKLNVEFLHAINYWLVLRIWINWEIGLWHASRNTCRQHSNKIGQCVAPVVESDRFNRRHEYYDDENVCRCWTRSIELSVNDLVNFVCFVIHRANRRVSLRRLHTHTHTHTHTLLCGLVFQWRSQGARRRGTVLAAACIIQH